MTVAVGRDATLSCVVDNLGSHRVSQYLASSFLHEMSVDSCAVYAGGVGAFGPANDPHHPPTSGDPSWPIQRLVRSSAHLATAHSRSSCRRRWHLHVISFNFLITIIKIISKV